MTGIPVVSLGPHFNTNEVCELIDSGVDGFFSDDIDELRACIVRLLEDAAYARKMGAAGRAKAASLFGLETIQTQWRAFIRALKERHACPL